MVLACCALTGCQLWSGQPPDLDCHWLGIESDPELLVTDRQLRQSARARNSERGELSFAARVSALGGASGPANADALWKLAGIDAGLSLDALPFRLLAVVNRTDLAEQLAPESPAGEGRLVYAMTNGPGDEPSSPALPLTVIFEYSLGHVESAATWGGRFHALASDRAGDVRWGALGALVERFSTPVPESSGSPRLAQVRVNDARSGAAQLHELVLEGSALVAGSLRNTPRLELAGAPALADFVQREAPAIRAGQHRVPSGWLATSAVAKVVDWKTGASADVERAFARATCAGCHAELGPARDGFHLSEDAAGDVVLSTFLTEEELPRRQAALRARLCADR